MSRYEDFQSAIKLQVNKFATYPNREAELKAIASALDGSEHGHDQTLVTKPDVLHIDGSKTAFQSAILHVVNKGYAGNIEPSDMADAMASLSGEVKPPTVIDTPHAQQDGELLTCTMGNWTHAPTGHAYQWKSGSTNIGTGGAQYVITSNDIGKVLTCAVTATNAAGSASSTSNGVTVASPVKAAR